MADLFNYTLIKGGAARSLVANGATNALVSQGPTGLTNMPTTVSWHDGPASARLWATMDVSKSHELRTSIAADEIAGVVPAGYTLYNVWVPPYCAIKGIGVSHFDQTDVYGIEADSAAGLVYDVVAFEVNRDPVTGADTVGTDVTAGVVPVAFANLVASTAGTVIAPVAPTTGGYYTGTKGVLFAFKLDTPPTVGLSNLKSRVTINVNVEHFEALRGTTSI